MRYDGSDLIFVACQPRSGSTLLRRMLGGHPAVHTVSEPWVMLPPAYTLRDDGVHAEYDESLARRGIRTFWKDLPGGRADYIEGVRRMYGFLYQRALQGTEANLFLDKTPRYYLILPELKEIFPRAQFILLIRNPLAVLSSILRTWIGEQWMELSYYQNDLLEAPGLLQEAVMEFGEEAEVIHYEKVVASPQSKISALCEHLGIEAESQMIESQMIQYSSEAEEEWRSGDTESVDEYSEPRTSSLEKWTRPDNAQQWRLLRDYLDELGEDTFETLGYGFDECVRKLESTQPSAAELRYTVSLDWLLKSGRQKSNRWSNHGVQMLNAMREGGPKSVVSYAVSRMTNRFF